MADDRDDSGCCHTAAGPTLDALLALQEGNLQQNVGSSSESESESGARRHRAHINVTVQQDDSTVTTNDFPVVSSDNVSQQDIKELNNDETLLVNGAKPFDAGTMDGPTKAQPARSMEQDDDSSDDSSADSFWAKEETKRMQARDDSKLPSQVCTAPEEATLEDTDDSNDATLEKENGMNSKDSASSSSSESDSGAPEKSDSSGDNSGTTTEGSSSTAGEHSDSPSETEDNRQSKKSQTASSSDDSSISDHPTMKQKQHDSDEEDVSSTAGKHCDSPSETEDDRQSKKRRQTASSAESDTSSDDSSISDHPTKKQKQHYSDKEDDSSLEVVTAHQTGNNYTNLAAIQNKPKGKIQRDIDPEVDDRVFAMWENGQWYWGKITNVVRRKKARYKFYSILFDDGDESENVPRTKIRTAREYRQEFEVDRISASCCHTLSPRDMFLFRCDKCALCTKPDCGLCSSCKRNKRSSSSDVHEVCLQKMCVEIHDSAKKQHAVGLPTDWKFIFTEDKVYKGQRNYVPGLYIFNPNGGPNLFRSIEAAIANSPSLKERNSNVIAEFNRHVGIKPTDYRGRNMRPGMTATKSGEMPFKKSKTAPPTLKRGSAARKKACGSCRNCMRAPCGKCFMCKNDTSGASSSCFQKMCYELPVEAKARPAPGFPNGWTFYFDKDPAQFNHISHVHKPISGLYIFSAGGKKFRSVEGAVAHSPALNANVRVIKQAFSTHVGLPDLLPREKKTTVAADSLTSFSKYRVKGSRVYCTLGNGGHWGIVEENVKAGHSGYVFTVRLEEDDSIIKDLSPEFVLSERSYKMETGLDPPPPPIRNVHSTSSGVATPMSIGGSLVGRHLCFTWTDVKDQKKVVYGKIFQCRMNHETGKVQLKVVYDPQTRGDANAISNDCSCTVPESQTLDLPLALGGCICLEQQISPTNDSILMEQVRNKHDYFRWISPDWRREDLAKDADGTGLPRLTLYLRGYRLELAVKKSNIPNAGNGVFLKCKPLYGNISSNGESRHFELPAGELVDLGVYAPFRIQDKKQEAAFFAKNFIHHHRCEEWAFDADESHFQFDITDDVTGDIHSLAMEHIHAYVNESDNHSDICISAEHDPEGCVHYLLGHEHQSQGSFRVPADGTEVEVYVNYGSKYELVRVRKGYSFLPDGDKRKEDLLEVIAIEDIVDVKQIYNSSAEEVESTVDSLFGLFSKESGFSDSVVQRALTVALVLQRRARKILFTEDGNDGTVNMRKVHEKSGDLVALLLKMIGDEEGQLMALQGNDEEVFSRVLKNQFSEEEMLELSDAMP